MKGYYISWHKHKSKPEQNKAVTHEPLIANEPLKEVLLASSDKNDIVIVNIPKFTFEVKELNEECDIIIFQNGDEVKAKIQEITLTEIKYTLCDDPKGKVLSTPKSKVFKIKYPNGTSELIKPEETVEKKPERIDYQTAHRSKKMQPFSLVGFIFAILTVFSLAIFGLSFGFFGVPLVFALLALLCGLIGIVSIKKNPDKYKGKAFSVLAIIFGLIFGGISLALFALV